MQLSTDIVDRESALGYLYGRIDYERITSVPYLEDEFKLDRMRELLDRLGNPQAGLPIVHLAGTKGKGSTAAMIAAVLSAAGYRTGLYTSPHLQGLEERFALDGAASSPAQLVELTRLVRPVVDEMDRQSELLGTSKGPTYFEITTAMALLFFTRAAGTNRRAGKRKACYASNWPLPGMNARESGQQYTPAFLSAATPISEQARTASSRQSKAFFGRSLREQQADCFAYPATVPTMRPRDTGAKHVRNLQRVHHLVGGL